MFQSIVTSSTQQMEAYAKLAADVSNSLDRFIDEHPRKSIDDSVTEAHLKPVTREQIASTRQELLATMVMRGIERIVVRNGKIDAKEIFDLDARDAEG